MDFELDWIERVPDPLGAVAMSGSRTREVLPDSEALARRIAERFKAACRASVDARGKFHVALSGGSTPRRAYEILGGLRGIPWSQVELFMGDERAVPLNHERSNYRMVKESLLHQVEDLVGRVHSIHPHEKSLEDVAARYQALLREILGKEGVFDLMLVGVGVDGSTASLYPGRREAELQPERLVVPVTDSPDGLDRVSLSPATYHAAREIWGIVTGERKAGIVRRLLEEPETCADLPAAHIQACQGDVVWFLDEGAAAGLAEGGARR